MARIGLAVVAAGANLLNISWFCCLRKISGRVSVGGVCNFC